MDHPNQNLDIVRSCLQLAGGSLEGQYATFDFDNSCIVNDIQEATLAYLCRNQLLKCDTLLGSTPSDREAYHRHVFLHYHRLLDSEKIKDAYLFAIRTMAGYTKADIDALVPEVIQYEGEMLGTQNIYGIKVAKGLSIRPQVKQLLESLLAAKCFIYILTASSEDVVNAALKFWHFPEAAVCIGSKNIEAEGVLTDVIEQPAPIIEGKVDSIKEYISPSKQPILAVGDTMNDLPMLEYSRVKVVVDRGNPLSQKAEGEGWWRV